VPSSTSLLSSSLLVTILTSCSASHSSALFLVVRVTSLGLERGLRWLTLEKITSFEDGYSPAPADSIEHGSFMSFSLRFSCGGVAPVCTTFKRLPSLASKVQFQSKGSSMTKSSFFLEPPDLLLFPLFFTTAFLCGALWAIKSESA
jgi:hypothetical protein